VYSAAEKQSARAVVLTVFESAVHLLRANLRTRLFLVTTCISFNVE